VTIAAPVGCEQEQAAVEHAAVVLAAQAEHKQQLQAEAEAAERAKREVAAAHQEQLQELRRELELTMEESTQAMQEELERERTAELELRAIQVAKAEARMQEEMSRERQMFERDMAQAERRQKESAAELIESSKQTALDNALAATAEQHTATVERQLAEIRELHVAKVALHEQLQVAQDEQAGMARAHEQTQAALQDAQLRAHEADAAVRTLESQSMALSQLANEETALAELSHSSALGAAKEKEKQLTSELNRARQAQVAASRQHGAAVVEMAEMQREQANARSEHLEQMQAAQRKLKDATSRLKAAAALEGARGPGKAGAPKTERARQKTQEHIVRQAEQHQKELKLVQRQHSQAVRRAEEAEAALDAASGSARQTHAELAAMQQAGAAAAQAVQETRARAEHDAEQSRREVEAVMRTEQARAAQELVDGQGRLEAAHAKQVRLCAERDRGAVRVRLVGGGDDGHHGHHGPGVLARCRGKRCSQASAHDGGCLAASLCLMLPFGRRGAQMDALREQHERELHDVAEVRPACLGSTACARAAGRVEISWGRA
jgi:hypothetical protein